MFGGCHQEGGFDLWREQAISVRHAQLGLKVALVEKRATLGGTCLNVGCIPSKALLASSEHYVFAKQHAAEHGVKLGSVELDLATLLKKKDSVVTKLVGGVAQLAKARKITVITGAAAFVSPNTIRVAASASEPTELTAKNIVIATGSAPVELPFLKFDGETIISSDHAISLPSVPQRLVVVKELPRNAMGKVTKPAVRHLF